ncbi:ABC transporter permease [Corynebacterium suedekumii]|uniref:ABC transporter permease n=1 Tax=Corynebacterium suedekumii TaxID=3049801 RepID=A0ABY8VMB1_9CORY|nr:ABC transporter permease [Corynebacterium suedekumii]WIM69788.1 ABC transporter permease [Corynebacterium suedekumii]WIM72420.1 ABC transporter permease [Corynebacterium suedekumii]
MTEITDTRFTPGTFTPAPERATRSRMIAAQGRMETILFLRHGEQQLLSIIIPLAMLVIAARIPLLGEDRGVTEIFPMMLAIATTSSGFTGQAIALAFDRRYGALKRTGASGVPAATIIAGKVIAVTVMAALQAVLLGGTALLLGWRVSPAGLLLGVVVLLVGVAAFTALGLLMGGTLPAELVLALANLIWVILVGTVGWVLYSQGLDDAGWYTLIPSVALASGLTLAFDGSVPWRELVVLTGWAVVASAAAVKWFRFSS